MSNPADHNGHTPPPSDEELAAIVGSKMKLIPALDMTEEHGRALTMDANKAVTDLARLLGRAAAHLGAGDADEAVVLGYDHTARCAYAEINLVELMRVTMSHMNGPNLKKNDVTNGAATPVVRVNDDGSSSVKLFLQGK